MLRQPEVVRDPFTSLRSVQDDVKGEDAVAGVRMSDQLRYYVYIMTNHSGTLYVGVTNDLERRVMEHKEFKIDGFTKRYRINRLVYYEETPSRRAAIEREKEIKGWKRNRKIQLIESVNPGWKDLSKEWRGHVI